jgi:hypothetical protein
MQHLFVCPHALTHTNIDQRFQEHTGVPRIVIVLHICTPVCKKTAAQRCHSQTALLQSHFFAQWVRFAHTHGVSRTGYPATQRAGCFPYVIHTSNFWVWLGLVVSCTELHGPQRRSRCPRHTDGRHRGRQHRHWQMQKESP